MKKNIEELIAHNKIMILSYENKPGRCIEDRMYSSGIVGALKLQNLKLESILSDYQPDEEEGVKAWAVKQNERIHLISISANREKVDWIVNNSNDVSDIFNYQTIRVLIKEIKE